MTQSDNDGDHAPLADEAKVNHYAVRRAATRLVAVQLLYQIEMTGKGWQTVVRESAAHSFAPDHPKLKIDTGFLERLVCGVVAQQAETDPAIQAALKGGWKLKRIDATLRAILRAGAFELLHAPDIPTAVVVSSYVDIASDFFGDSEAGFVNAALDQLAANAGQKDARPT